MGQFRIMDITMSTWALACCGMLFLMVKIAKVIWWRRLQIQKHFESQGISGPPCRLIYGSMLDMLKIREQAISRPMELSHDIIPRALSFYSSWTESYGNTFIHWFGSTARLNITDPELIWEVLCNKSGLYKKSVQMKQLNGEGLLSLEGEMWAQHRKIINPAFHVEHLKGMVPMVIGSASTMLNKWKERIESGENEIEVCKEFQSLTEDILAHTVFGSSYSEGKRVFAMQSEQALLITEVPRSLLRAMISRFLPTRKNRYMRKLDREIRSSLRQLIQSKKQAWSLGRSSSYGGDLISVLTAGNKDQQQQPGVVLQKSVMSTEEIMEECKTFFFAGHDTTLCLLAWTMILLGMHPQWQDRARKEILSICRQEAPKPENVNQLKIMGMVLNESLRLYPPVVALIRQTGQDMKLGNISVPGARSSCFQSSHFIMTRLYGGKMPRNSILKGSAMESPRLPSIPWPSCHLGWVPGFVLDRILHCFRPS